MKIVNGFDIDTVEGSRDYLKSQGIDPDEEIKYGMKIIKEIKNKIALKKELEILRELKLNHNRPMTEEEFERFQYLAKKLHEKL